VALEDDKGRNRSDSFENSLGKSYDDENSSSSSSEQLVGPGFLKDQDSDESRDQFESGTTDSLAVEMVEYSKSERNLLATPPVSD